MIKENYSIVAVASWEDRFPLGTERNVKSYSPEKIFMFYYKEYETRTENNRKKITAICNENNIELHSIRVDFEQPENTWKIFENTFSKEVWNSKKVLVDISTMPRDSIYGVFHFLEHLQAEINYIYYRPEKYNSVWLSRDPIKPRLVFKHSGIVTFGKKTILVVITGFDAERTEQLINFFEPAITLLGFQEGKQFNNDKYNVEKHKEHLTYLTQTKIETFFINAYSNDHGFNILEDKIKEHTNDCNIIMSSLGPKLSAVALYNICKKYPQVAIAHASSKDFNPEYSYGIGETYSGKL